jgi:hypothetical protein
MDLYATLYYGKKQVKEGKFHLEVEFCSTPANLWLVTHHKEDINEKEGGVTGDIIYPKKIIQLIYGAVRYNDVVFDVELCSTYMGINIEHVLLSGGCRNDDGNYHLDVESGDMLLDSNSFLIVDFDEIAIIPEFTGKSKIEVINELLYCSSGSDYGDLFRFYKLKGEDKVYTQKQFNAYLAANPKLGH